MSEERAIRINKVLRELNISLERAVDYLKEKDHNIDASPNAEECCVRKLLPVELN